MIEMIRIVLARELMSRALSLLEPGTPGRLWLAEAQLQLIRFEKSRARAR